MHMAEDLTIMHADGDSQTVEAVLTKDMTTICEYLQTWKLKLITTKTMSAAFHLNNKEAKRELNVNYSNETLPFCPKPIYLGIKLNRTLTYRRHFESLRKKLTSRVALLRRLAGSGWGAGATTLRIATLALVHSTAEEATALLPGAVARKPASLILSSTTPCQFWLGACVLHQRTTLFILAGIQPDELRRNGATLSLARLAMEPGHLLHSALTRPASANARHLKSRHPFVLAAQQPISSSDNNDIRVAHWANHQWNAEWGDNLQDSETFISDIGSYTLRMTLPRRASVQPNRLRTVVRRFRSYLHKLGMVSSAACECVAEEQIVDHVVLQCPIRRPPHGLHGLTVLDDETIEWLLNTCPEI